MSLKPGFFRAKFLWVGEKGVSLSGQFFFSQGRGEEVPEEGATNFGQFPLCPVLLFPILVFSTLGPWGGVWGGGVWGREVWEGGVRERERGRRGAK